MAAEKITRRRGVSDEFARKHSAKFIAENFSFFMKYRNYIIHKITKTKSTTIVLIKDGRDGWYKNVVHGKYFDKYQMHYTGLGSALVDHKLIAGLIERQHRIDRLTMRDKRVRMILDWVDSRLINPMEKYSRWLENRWP